MSTTFWLHNRESTNILNDLLTGLGFIKSTPTSGDYTVTDIRLDTNKDVFVKYDETPEA